MKALILAAGYATRLYPLTKDFPKPLLKVGDKTILDYLVDQLEKIACIDKIYLVTNAKYASHFNDWNEKRGAGAIIINDHTTSNETRLGSIGDIQFVIEQAGIDDDLFALASDNIFKFQLADFVAEFTRKPATWVCAHYSEDIKGLQRKGNIVFGQGQSVAEFVEKPEHPKSNWSCPPLYLYPQKTLPQIKAYLDAGNNPDAPGHFIAWLYSREPVYAHKIEGQVLDIGTLESLEEARKIFSL